jgi:hypothetical protein
MAPPTASPSLVVSWQVPAAPAEFVEVAPGKRFVCSPSPCTGARSQHVRAVVVARTMKFLKNKNVIIVRGYFYFLKTSFIALCFLWAWFVIRYGMASFCPLSSRDRQRQKRGKEKLMKNRKNKRPKLFI